MSGTELIMGMGEVINYLKELEAENKKLKASSSGKYMEQISALNKQAITLRHNWKEEVDRLEEQNEAKEATIRSLSAGLEQYKQENKKLQDYSNEEREIMSKVIEVMKQENNKLKEDLEQEKSGRDHDVQQFQSVLEEKGQLEAEVEELKDENKKLKDEKECIQRQMDSVLQANEKLKNKLNVSEVKRTEAESELESFQNFTRDYDYEDNYNEWLKGNHEDYSGTWLDNWYDEHFDKYEDGDDWDWGYGYIVKDGEYRIHMAGGGDHWEDYVMDKNGCFIHNKEGKKKVFTFVSCPAGNYIKVWDTPDMEGGLVLDEGETDMYEMVKDAYEEEIMNYEPEESESEVEDNDPEEYGEYMFYEGLTKEQVEEIEKIDAETGEVKE